jgi:hypothetical protein
MLENLIAPSRQPGCYPNLKVEVGRNFKSDRVGTAIANAVRHLGSLMIVYYEVAKKKKALPKEKPFPDAKR